MDSKVAWKTKGLFKADAQKCYEELGDNGLTPEQIVEKARDENSELHKCFEWDDTKAAEKYRLTQARSLMCNLVFVTEDQKAETRVFYNLTFEKTEYKPTKLILQKPDEYQLLVQKALGELQAFKKKYAHIKELKKVFEIIDEL